MSDIGFRRTFEQRPALINTLAMCVGLGLAFQVGHFIEHAVQFGVWIGGQFQWVAAAFCGRDTPYMSPPLTAMVRFVGRTLFPDANEARQMMLGMELLHLMGNAAFVMTITGAYYLMPNKWIRWALYIEGGHLCEHLALTLTAYYVGKPIGISTLFGQAPYYFGRNGAVGYRVAWHFAMNLLPMPFVMVGMMKHKAMAELGFASPPVASGAAA
jgi:hypothetical protein